MFCTRLSIKLRTISEVWNTRFELTEGKRKTFMESSYSVIEGLPVAETGMLILTCQV